VEPRSVSSTVFDHTSIIKSVLLRFCPQALNPPAKNRSWRLRTYHPQHPGTRVAHAAHLGELLTRTAPRPAPPRDPLVTGAAARVAEQAKGNNGATGQAGPEGHAHTDLQKGFLAAAHQLTRWGDPAGKP
jgi:phospholipase C